MGCADGLTGRSLNGNWLQAIDPGGRAGKVLGAPSLVGDIICLWDAAACFGLILVLPPSPDTKGRPCKHINKDGVCGWPDRAVTKWKLASSDFVLDPEPSPPSPLPLSHPGEGIPRSKFMLLDQSPVSEPEPPSPLSPLPLGRGGPAPGRKLSSMAATGEGGSGSETGANG
jgi:hypothetical protein